MKTTKYSLIALLIAASTLNSYAQDEYEGPSNADREARRAKMMARFDTDGDGVLSQEERQAAREARQTDGIAPERRGRGREGLKREGHVHGAMSEDRKAEIMAKFDADGDGMLSKEERAAAREARRENGMNRGPRGEKRQGLAGMNHERTMDLVQKFDVDGNGELSGAERAAMKAYSQAKREELKAQAVEKFDIDGNGELSGAERAAMQAYTQAKKEERNNDK